MNIASFLLPKVEVSYARDDMTLRQGLERLKRSGFMAIPVIDVEDRYVGVISEGDFLWNILDRNRNLSDITMKKLEHMTVRDIIQGGKVKPVCISTAMETLIEQAKNQNFVPVIDDRSVFIGIVTRSDIIKYFAEKCKGNEDSPGGFPVKQEAQGVHMRNGGRREELAGQNGRRGGM